jgi:hypothetical protein
MSDLSLSSILSKDQELILASCYLHISKSKSTYLQYIEARTLMYLLLQKKFLNYDPDETPVYDNKEGKRYIEIKRF